jgi:DNA topoisomerase-1
MTLESKLETNKESSSETHSEAPLYNKRQFWNYKRFHSKGTKKQYSQTHKKTKQNIEPKNRNDKGTQSVPDNYKDKDKIKKTKIFHLVNNKIATDRDLIKRLDAIYIPPAYTDVVVAKSANNKIQAIGTDTRGRRQYIYNPTFIKRRNDRKYDDILELAKKITAIEADNHAMLQSLGRKPHSEWQLPADFIPVIVYMLRTYHFRIGNQRYVDENHSYGITTLRKEHIKWHPSIPNRFTIEFIGKKGILNSFTDENMLMAKLLSHLCDRCGGQNEGYLFRYQNPTTQEVEFITPEQIQAFFQDKYNAYITPKMFRTWYGNYHLLGALQNMYQHGELKYRLRPGEKNDLVRKCSEYVSSKLNNTPTVSKQSYIDDKILELVMRNPYRLASMIPASDEGLHRFLYKILTRVRNTNR